MTKRWIAWLCALSMLFLSLSVGLAEEIGEPEPAPEASGEAVSPSGSEAPGEPAVPESPAPAAPETPDATETPDSPSNPDAPVTPGDPDAPDAPETPGDPDAPDAPETPGDPDNPDAPETPGGPDNPDAPVTPDSPDDPDAPETPDNPDDPDAPVTPDSPDDPDAPVTPGDPDDPDAPETPDSPDDPDDPETPDNPDDPDAPVTPGDPDDPDAPETPDSPDDPDAPVTPGDPESPDDPDNPGTPDDPENPDEPDDPEAPDDPDEPSGVTVQMAVSDAAFEAGIWTLPYHEDGSVTISWSWPEGAESWILTVSGGMLTERGAGTSCTLPMISFGKGSFNIRLEVFTGEASIAAAQLTLVLADPQDIPEEPATPSDLPDDSDDQGRPDGQQAPAAPQRRIRYTGRRSSRSSAAAGFQVTPGKALTTTHAKGTQDMQLYGTVALETDDRLMQRLEIGGTELDISCGGGWFTAELEESRLLLGGAESSSWTMTQAALNTLAKSGVSELVLATEDGEYAVDTSLSFTGLKYGQLRAKGLVAKDFSIHLSGGAITVVADGETYTLADGELLPAEAD